MSKLFVGGSASLFLIIIGVFIFLQFVPVGLWISAISAGVSISIFNLVGMRLRRVPPDKIVLPLIKANKAGLHVNSDQLEAHYLAGGNVDRVIDALIAAHRAAIIQARRALRGRHLRRPLRPLRPDCPPAGHRFRHPQKQIGL